MLMSRALVPEETLMKRNCRTSASLAQTFFYDSFALGVRGVRVTSFFLLSALGALLLCSSSARAWGGNAQKLVLTKAIDTLPADLRGFFDSKRTALLQHLSDPIDEIAQKPSERRNHFINLDKYGRFPFTALPRNYKAALDKFGRSKLNSNGLLPWEIGVYSAKLTEAMRASRWDEARIDAAILAYYVTEAHDPFSTTDDFDGHLSGQTGINERFGTTLIDRFSSFFPMRPNDATYIPDPTDHAFDICLEAHSWLETILLADRKSRQTQSSYTDEYFDRFYNLVAPSLLRQLSDSATDVGSYWLTAWTNAGKPSLPH